MTRPPTWVKRRVDALPSYNANDLRIDAPVVIPNHWGFHVGLPTWLPSSKLITLPWSKSMGLFVRNDLNMWISISNYVGRGYPISSISNCELLLYYTKWVKRDGFQSPKQDRSKPHPNARKKQLPVLIIHWLTGSLHSQGSRRDPRRSWNSSSEARIFNAIWAFTPFAICLVLGIPPQKQESSTPFEPSHPLQSTWY
jgi:hypothetical protein